MSEVNRLKKKIAKLRNEIEMLEGKLKPIEDKIAELRDKAEPIKTRIYDKKDELRMLERTLEIEEAWESIRNLKLGDKVWIIYSRLANVYFTITEEQAKNILEERKAWETIPHCIEITQIIQKENEKPFMFFAIDKKTKQRYIGEVIDPDSWYEVEPSIWCQRGGEPEILWTKAK